MAKYLVSVNTLYCGEGISCQKGEYVFTGENIMIKEDYKELTNRTTVTRICDECGKSEKRSLASILYSKSRRRHKKDLCKKCSYLYRDTNQKKGDQSPFWTGGVSINMKGGYLRLNKSGEYLHKKILGDFLVRKITKKEQVHHINMNKLDNSISNLYLCKNKIDHHSLHSQMEELGMSLVGDLIWINRSKKIYTTKKCKNKKLKCNIDKKPSYFNFDHNGKKYSHIYVGNKRYIGTHRYTYSKYLGAKLSKNDHVHHINGDSLDNDINNLLLLSRKDHKICHNSLQLCVMELYKVGIVKFDKERGIYYV